MRTLPKLHGLRRVQADSLAVTLKTLYFSPDGALSRLAAISSLILGATRAKKGGEAGSYCYRPLKNKPDSSKQAE